MNPADIRATPWPPTLTESDQQELREIYGECPLCGTGLLMPRVRVEGGEVWTELACTRGAGCIIRQLELLRLRHDVLFAMLALADELSDRVWDGGPGDEGGIRIHDANTAYRSCRGLDEWSDRHLGPDKE